MNTPMTRGEIVVALKAKGFTHVRTFGGPMPLDSWNPYGMEPGGVNYRDGDKPYLGHIVEHEGRTEVHDHDADSELGQQCMLVLGVWQFTKPEGS